MCRTLQARLKPFQPQPAVPRRSYGEKQTNAANCKLPEAYHTTRSSADKRGQTRPPLCWKLRVVNIGSQRLSRSPHTRLLRGLSPHPRPNSGALIGAVRMQRQLQAVRASVNIEHDTNPEEALIECCFVRYTGYKTRQPGLPHYLIFESTSMRISIYLHGNFHLLLWKLPPTSMEVDLLPLESMEENSRPRK